MEKSKIWIKDRFSPYSFIVGDIVFLIRKKQNGYPKNLSFGKEYTVVKIENEDLYVEEEEASEIKGLARGIFPRTHTHKNLNMKLIKKCHFSYFIKKSSYREEVIRDILGC